MSDWLNSQFNNPGELDNWEIWLGDPTHAFIADGVLNLGTNSTGAGDGLVLVHRDLIPYSDLNIYRSYVSAKHPVGGQYLSVGFIGIAADGVTVVDYVGGTNWHLSFWHLLLTDLVDAETFTEYLSSTTGFSNPGSLFPSGDLDYPAAVHDDVRYLRPIIAANTNMVPGALFQAAGIHQLEYYIINVFSWTPGTGTGSSVYAITPQSATANRGAYFALTITATEFTDGAVFWKIVPVTGTVTVDDFNIPALQNGINIISGEAVLYFNLPEPNGGGLGNTETTEESFIIELRTGSFTGSLVAQTGTITISYAAPVYTLTTTEPKVGLSSTTYLARRGQALNLHLETTNRPNPDRLDYTIWPQNGTVTAADFDASQPMSGILDVYNNDADFQVLLSDTGIQESTQESFYFIIAGVSLYFEIYDVFPYILTQYAEDINEGLDNYYYVYAPKLPIGTAIPCVITGITHADIDSMTVNGDAVAITLNPVLSIFDVTQTSTLQVTFKNDFLTEGTQTFTLTLTDPTGFLLLPSPAPSISTTILDTSPEIPPLTFAHPYRLVNYYASTIDEGMMIDIYLFASTDYISTGTHVPYRIDGIDVDDMDFIAVNGEVLVNSRFGEFIVINPYHYSELKLLIRNDYFTEGTETFSITLLTGDPQETLSITLNDTSLSVPITLPETPAPNQPPPIPEPPPFTLAGLQLRDSYNRLILDTSNRMAKLYGAFYFPVNAGTHYIDIPGENTSSGEWQAHSDDQWVWFGFGAGYISCYQPNTVVGGTFTVKVTKQ